MGLESGRVSLSRYKVLGAPKRVTFSLLGENYRKYLAKPLKIQNNKELMFGWAHPIAFDEETTGGYWDMSHCAYDDGFIFRIQIERRKVPASLLTQLYKQRITKAQKSGKPLSRIEKSKLRDEIKLDLIKSALPEIKFVDLVWNTTIHEVHLLTTTKADVEIFEKLFRQSFSDHLNLNVIPIRPPLLGLELDQYQRPERHRKLFEDIANTEPTLFSIESVD